MAPFFEVSCERLYIALEQLYISHSNTTRLFLMTKIPASRAVKRLFLDNRARSPLPPFSASFTQPNTAILPNLSLSTNQLSGRLTLLQNFNEFNTSFWGRFSARRQSRTHTYQSRSNHPIFRLHSTQKSQCESRLTAKLCGGR